MLCAALALLAQAPAPSPTVPDFDTAVKTAIILLVLGAVPTVIASVNGILSIIKWFKPDPPAHKEYATKAEVTGVQGALKAEIASVETRIKDQLNRTGCDIADIEKSLGEFTERSDRYREGLNHELKSIARQMGEVHGLLQRATRAK
jgi:hypothetical protein